jgi:hypothetical protein
MSAIEKKVARALQQEFVCSYTVALMRVRANVGAAEQLLKTFEPGQITFRECLERVTREDMRAWRSQP